MLQHLLPADISSAFAISLIFASFFTSALTAAFGIGGGLTLLAVMATSMPVATLIPVHGVIQFGSNAGRTLVQRAHIDWRIVMWFCGGGIIGAFIGAATVVTLPDGPMKVAIAVFILLVVWGPKPPGIGQSPFAMGLGGLLGGALTMFFGATGPFTTAVIATRKLNKLTQVATSSMCLTVQHILKVLTFGLLGFAFRAWLPLIAAMITTGFIGTLAGSALLKRLPEHLFYNTLKGLLTVLSLYLAWQGWQLLGH